jgi:hypothetical protein
MCKMAIRGLELVLLILNWVVLCLASPNFIAEFKYLTIWGMFLTLISIVLSLFFCKDETAYLAPDFIEKPYAYFQLWKWYIFIFELAISFEVIIAPYFWAFLWSAWNTGKEGTVEELNLIFCHSFSIAILLLEFFVVNAFPISFRHFSAIFFIMILYMIDNVIFVTVTGKAVYPGITWDSVSGILMPLGVIFITFLFYGLLVCCSK